VEVSSPVRSTIDLLDLPFTFTQLRPLTADAFRDAARDRGLLVSEQELEALHRTRLLIPFFRVRRDTREIARLALRNEGDAIHLAHWQPTSRTDLLAARESGSLRDPFLEPFIARHRLKRQLSDGRSYDASVYLYSPHQLIAIPQVEHLRAWRWLILKRQRGQIVGDLNVSKEMASDLQGQARHWRDISIALTALEPIHYSRITGSLRLPGEEDFRAYDKWIRGLSSTAHVRWLGVGSEWLVSSGRRLLSEAHRISPLGSFDELIGRSDPDRWRELRGPARNTIDFRIGGELLFREHDRLVRKRKAKAVPPIPSRFPSELHLRLTPRRSLDALIYSFGLSRHPKLILVIEGKTEQELLPRALDRLGVRWSDDFIQILNAEGVDRDLEALMAYIAPRLAGEREDRYVRFERPPTRVLIVVDPEGRAKTLEARNRWHANLLDRIMRTLGVDYDTQVVRDQVMNLIEIRTWNARGESFEFAHFTDRELAGAIDAIDLRSRRPSFARRTAAVARVRESGGNLKKTVLNDVAGKGRLATELWPILARKLDRAEARGTVSVSWSRLGRLSGWCRCSLLVTQ
jgi:hypothetical protein